MAENRALVDVVRGIATELGSTPAQTALAWVLACGPHVIPIPGTRALDRLEEDLASTRVRLSADQIHQLDQLPSARGARCAAPISRP
jgi:aryl-alcohol dehydrogenase-like predicted oxidoreductase